MNKYDSNLHNRMSGYRKRHSCETTLIRLAEDWKTEIDNKDQQIVANEAFNPEKFLISNQNSVQEVLD